jgi:DNA-binding MltR family transcriptional regulator
MLMVAEFGLEERLMSKALRRFIKTRAPDEERNLIAKEVMASSPRAGAMVASAFLDEILKALILLHMESLSDSEIEALFEPERPLASFSSKIKVARALGIIGPKTSHDLNLMREIRNAFAHSLRKMSFETPSVRQLLHSMHVVKDIPKQKQRRARTLFFEVTAMILTHLHQKGHVANQRKRISPSLGSFCPHLD